MEIHNPHPDMGYRYIRDTLKHDYGIDTNDIEGLFGENLEEASFTDIVDTVVGYVFE